MSDVVIKVENLSKQYRLGTVGTGTLAHDLNRWWCKLRGKPDPYLKVTQTNDRAHKGDSDYVWALRDINFEVKQGEVLGIIGRNGAGKSTLLKILSRVTAPTEGIVRAKGRIASLLEVGTGFHPELTGRENIFLNGAILGMTKAEVRKKLDEIVDFSGCERYLDTPVKRYSSGMMVRLGFAVAAHLEPEILIVDEVLAVGDAEFQRKCLGKMKDVAGHGRTVLFVSHNMGSVSTLCSTAFVLADGSISARGSVREAVDAYTNSVAPDRPVVRAGEIPRQSGSPITIAEVAVVNSSGEEAWQADVFDALTVRIAYAVIRELRGTNMSLRLSRNGIELLTSFSTDMPTGTGNRGDWMPGKYESFVPLPCPLKAGRYGISVGAGIVNTRTFASHQDVVGFEVVESRTDVTRLALAAKRPGCVAAMIPWEIARLD